MNASLQSTKADHTRITFEIPSRDWWVIARKAESAGMPLAQFVVATMQAAVYPAAVLQAVGGEKSVAQKITELNAEGRSDVEIAALLHLDRSRVARVRRDLDLPAYGRPGRPTRNTQSTRRTTS